jgi:hypothetical protein
LTHDLVTYISYATMAEFATPSTAAVSSVGAAKTAPASKEKSAAVAKPERPDEEVYKAELAKAEKELKSAEERLVRLMLIFSTMLTLCSEDSRQRSILHDRTTRTHPLGSVRLSFAPSSQPSVPRSNPQNPPAVKSSTRLSVLTSN